jgi:hypothetical protein
MTAQLSDLMTANDKQCGDLMIPYAPWSLPLAKNLDNGGHEPIFLIMSLHFCKVPKA